MIIAYVIILGTCTTIATTLGNYRVKYHLDNEYFTIGVQILAVVSGFFVYIFYVLIAVKIKVYRKRKRMNSK